MPNKGYKQSLEHRAKLSKIRLGCIPWNKTNIFRECPTCSKKFKIKPCLINSDRYCSRRCYSISLLGKPTWNKGIKMGPIHRTVSTKGKHFSPKTEFKKGQKPHNYKGGITTKSGGYVMIKVVGHPGMGKFGYIKRSHLVVEKTINRFIKKNEIVHHINNIPSDDSPENLMLFSNASAHHRFHFYPEKASPEEIIFDGRKLPLQSNQT